MSTIWTHQSVECLINELRKRKMLYDTTHADYINRPKRLACLEGICKVLHDKERLDVTPDEVKAKIGVLRSQLNKELRYMARSKKYKPSLWCFKKIEFLRPFLVNGRLSTPYSTDTASSNGPQPSSGRTLRSSADQNENTSNSAFEADAPSSSSIFTSKPTEEQTIVDNNSDMTQQFYDTVALTQHLVQTRLAAKQQRTASSRKHLSWAGELVTSHLKLITDDTIRNDTMWEIQCVLRRGIEQDRVLPKRRRRNRRSSEALSEISADGSCISLDSNDTEAKDNTSEPLTNGSSQILRK